MLKLKFLVFAALGLSLALGLAGSGGRSLEAQESSLKAEVEAASSEYGVPADLLLAMGYVNTRWEMPPPGTSDYEKGDIEARGHYGVMSLAKNPSQDTLVRAAELTGLSEERLKTDRAANIQGAAAVLADLQGASKPPDINGWYDAVSGYGGGSLYANQVYETLKSGASATISTGEKVTLAPNPDAQPKALFTAQSSADYSRATWYGASDNYTRSNREASYNIDRIVIHVTQGSWSSAINWFQNPSADVSAHYTIRSSDGKIGQSVHEKDIAWHAGNWDYNTRSIGIEHEGYVDDPKWFTDAMYRSSARLSAYLAKKYKIPIDRQHIIGHNEVPGATHTDPGKYWNWTKYMNLVREYAGKSTSSVTYRQTVDNTSSRFGASKVWKLSSWNSQKYGKNYRYTTPRKVKGAARYKFKVPKKGRYAVSAWWPANKGYNSRTQFRIRTSDGWVKRVRDQRKNGGRWVWLGTFDLPPGDQVYVRILRNSSGKGYVIADAVRIKQK